MTIEEIMRGRNIRELSDDELVQIAALSDQAMFGQLDRLERKIDRLISLLKKHDGAL